MFLREGALVLQDFTREHFENSTNQMATENPRGFGHI